MSAAHTPGPLHLIHGEDCPSCGRDNAQHGGICTSDDCPGVTLCDSAPELLESLKEFEHFAKHNQGTAKGKARYERLVAAIAKATGKEAA